MQQTSFEQRTNRMDGETSLEQRLHRMEGALGRIENVCHDVALGTTDLSDNVDVQFEDIKHKLDAHSKLLSAIKQASRQPKYIIAILIFLFVTWVFLLYYSHF
jgi:hypothetical protein